MIRLVAFGKKKKKSQLYLKADLVWPVAVCRGVKNFSFTLFFIICKKQQGEGLSSYKYWAFSGIFIKNKNKLCQVNNECKKLQNISIFELRVQFLVYPVANPPVLHLVCVLPVDIFNL